MSQTKEHSKGREDVTERGVEPSKRRLAGILDSMEKEYVIF